VSRLSSLRFLVTCVKRSRTVAPSVEKVADGIPLGMTVVCHPIPSFEREPICSPRLHRFDPTSGGLCDVGAIPRESELGLILDHVPQAFPGRIDVLIAVTDSGYA